MHVRAWGCHWCLSELLYCETTKEKHTACVSGQRCVGAGSYVSYRKHVSAS